MWVRGEEDAVLILDKQFLPFGVKPFPLKYCRAHHCLLLGVGKIIHQPFLLGGQQVEIRVITHEILNGFGRCKHHVRQQKNLVRPRRIQGV